MSKVRKPDNTKSGERRDYRVKPVQFGFIQAQGEPEAEPLEAPLPADTPKQREHDAIMQDIADLRTTILQTMTGDYKMPPKLRGPKENKRRLIKTLDQLFGSKPYPKTINAIERAIEQTYTDNGWPMPHRNLIGEVTKDRRSKT